ncbi:MAG: 50S ribosomal protein L13 [Bacteroidales bacterium]|nr:50S ribosomal protein L13 [Bacteroidales bacterium]
MNTLSYKTVSLRKEDVKKEWWLLDAEDQVLGRLSSKVANILRGKYKPDFTPHIDCGDNVIIINADKVKLTGNKLTDKIYTRHTGYPGGQRFATPKDMLKKKPEFIIKKAIKGMLPKNKLGSQILDNLFIYQGTEHPHSAQQPKTLNLNSIK